MNQQGHSIDTFGIGTNLVTCQNQTALGGVYKLVVNKYIPRLKLSQILSKVSIPARKETYRLFDSERRPILDLMIEVGETPPSPGVKVMCRHPFEESKRTYVIPSSVVLLQQLVWDGRQVAILPDSEKIRSFISENVKNLRSDHVRFLNPTPYKVSISEGLYTTFHNLWLLETPVSCIE